MVTYLAMELFLEEANSMTAVSKNGHWSFSKRIQCEWSMDQATVTANRGISWLCSDSFRLSVLIDMSTMLAPRRKGTRSSHWGGGSWHELGRESGPQPEGAGEWRGSWSVTGILSQLRNWREWGLTSCSPVAIERQDSFKTLLAITRSTKGALTCFI